MIGACGISEQHQIFIWHREFGNIHKVLEGPVEGLSDVAVLKH